MALETLATTQLLNYLLHNSISPSSPPLQPSSFLSSSNPPPKSELPPPAGVVDKRRRPEITTEPAAVQQQERKKKRRKRQKTSKDKAEAESQRMTHITVERNRRKTMNQHLAVLRSLMPPSYAQRGDQASIVGGAIDFLKELEHRLHTLEAQKHLLLIQQGGGAAAAASATFTHRFLSSSTTTASGSSSAAAAAANTTPFSQFFTNPQYICSKYQNTCPPQNHQCMTSSCSKDDDDDDEEGVGAMADIEVTLIETHANVRILSRRRKVKQLSRLVTGFHSIYLTILHLNVTTLELDPLLVLYSISAKVEEGCVLSTADDIAGAVNHILRIIGGDEAHAH